MIFERKVGVILNLFLKITTHSNVLLLLVISQHIAQSLPQSVSCHVQFFWQNTLEGSIGDSQLVCQVMDGEMPVWWINSLTFIS
jgi:hypothetical protein